MPKYPGPKVHFKVPQAWYFVVSGCPFSNKQGDEQMLASDNDHENAHLHTSKACKC